jgi:uncharacterized Zn finger protein (UPF0148 family)
MEEVLTCQICFEQYNSNVNNIKHPILLDCGHGMCEECSIDIFFKWGALNCPFCRKLDVTRIENRELMKVIDAYSANRSEMENLKQSNDAMNELSNHNQAVINDLQRENTRVTERIEKIRTNHREELIYWQQSNSELNDKLDSTENELAQLKSKYNQLKDSISVHCGLLLTQINTNEKNSSSSPTNKRKIRD